MAKDSCDTTVNMMDITYSTEMTILGFKFSSEIGQSGKSSWARVTGQVRAMAREGYGRDLCLNQRIQYAHASLFTKIWRIAQIFPISKDHVRQLATAIAWFIWKGMIFRVPISFPTKGENELWPATIGYRGEMLRPIPNQNERPRGKGGNSDCSMAPEMGPAITTGKPAKHRQDSEEVRIPCHLCP